MPTTPAAPLTSSLRHCRTVPDNRLAIDFGKVRTGVAASYGGTSLAFPVETVAGGGAGIHRLGALVEEYEADVVYVGLPLRLDGTRSFAAQWVVEQAEALAARIGVERIRLVDERMSTATASRTLVEAGHSQKRSRRIIDQAAAVEILNRALDLERATGGLAGEGLREEM